MQKKKKKKKVENAVYEMSSTEKKAELINSVIHMQSPNSKGEIRKTVTIQLKSISKSRNLSIILLGKYYCLHILFTRLLKHPGKESLREYRGALINLRKNIKIHFGTLANF